MSRFEARLILIDLDGTLVDSVPDLAWAVDATMDDLGLSRRGEQAVRHWVGNGVERLVKRALTQQLAAEPASELYARALPVFMAHYQASNGKYSRLFPGVEQGVRELAATGRRLGCVTNKAEQFTLPLLDTLGILKYFGLVVSGDTTPHKKPHPEPLLHAARHFDIAPEHSLMVGDSRHDVEAARAAGFKVLCVNYGYNHGEDIRHAAPDAVIDSLVDVKNFLT
ncbi:MAG: phosphoglycolate phosphatase [Pseudomonadota bacterium]